MKKYYFSFLYALITLHTNFHKLRTIPSTKSWVRVLVLVVLVLVVTGGK